MIYSVDDKPKTLTQWALYSIQQVFAVFCATVLIAVICGTPISSCLFGACVGTLVYQLITKGRSPIFISSSGATVSAVVGALTMENGGYLAVVIGGLIICLVYCGFAAIVHYKGVATLSQIITPEIIGAITVVIGLNLASFIPTYVQVNGQQSTVGMLIAIFTMFVVALCSRCKNNFLRTIPFLIGLAAGYVLCVIITICGGTQLVDFSAFSNIHLFALPDFTFKYWSFASISWSVVGKVILLFVPVALCALAEHWSDHKVLSHIIGTDLTANPGLARTLVGDGVASFVGTIVCGLPNTSFGESIATIGVSRVASRRVITVAALILGSMAFVEPIQVMIASVPNCVFGGCAMLLYGYIAASGLQTLASATVDLHDNRTLIIISTILTVGVSGVMLFNEAFSGVSLAMVLGIILNTILPKKTY